MNQGDIIKEISRRLFLTSAETKEAFALILKKITDELKKGNRVYVRDFGTLQKIKRKKKKGYNFKKRKTITIPEHFTIEFRPARDLLKKISR